MFSISRNINNLTGGKTLKSNNMLENQEDERMKPEDEEGKSKEKHPRISLYPKEDEIEKPSYFEKPEKPLDAKQKYTDESENDEG